MTGSRMQLFRETLATPIGTVLILTDESALLRAVDFHDYVGRMNSLLDRHYGASGWNVRDAAVPTVAGRALEAYFSGAVDAIDTLATATAGSVFQQQVWTALRNVPAGTTVSYGLVAARLGQPTASRAVGMANGRNPIAIVVPCHRIIGGSGALTGYGGGMERKRWLIDHEAVHVARSRVAGDAARYGNASVCA